MKENPLRKKLSTDAKLVGGWLTLADPFSAEMIASVGFDDLQLSGVDQSGA